MRKVNMFGVGMLSVAIAVQSVGAPSRAVVDLPSGDIVLDSPVWIGQKSQGTIYRGAADGSTRFTGGIKIGPWVECERGVWSAPLPFGSDGEVCYTETLFVNGRRAQRARMPNSGYFHMTGTADEASCEKSPTKFRQMVWLPEDVAAVLGAVPQDELGFAQFVVHVKWDCARYPIAGFSGGRVSVHGGRMKGTWKEWTTNELCAVENLRFAFDAPGEWFCDAMGGRILYRVLPGETIQDAVIPREGLSTLLFVDGVSDVTFENVTFAYSAPVAQKGPSACAPDQAASKVSAATVIIDRSTNVVFRNCRFEKTGNYAVWFRKDVLGGGVYSCEMTDLGAGGVRIGTHELKKAVCATDGVTVDDCLIAGGGRFHPSGVGVLIAHASGCSVLHNEICDLFYTGVSVGWTWGYGESPSRRNTVAFNLIHDIGKGELADMGGVYTLGASEGTAVSNNVIHGVHSYSYGGWGLYADEGSRGAVFENNIVYDTDDASFHLHYGRDNILRNNILVDSSLGQIAVTKGEDHRSLVCERNVVVWTAGDAFVKYKGTTSERARVDWRSNVWWRVDGVAQFNGTSFVEWRERVGDIGSVFADPQFRDWRARDFTLDARSPALVIGFRPFDHSLAGRRVKTAGGQK